MLYRTVDPSTGELVRDYASHSDSEMEEAIREAQKSFRSWRLSEWSRRVRGLGALSDLLTERKDDLARLMAVEMGKPIGEGRAEADKCAWACRHYAEQGSRYLASEEIELGESRAEVRCAPLGPILAIMPWNFPFWQLFRCGVPAIAAGNVVLLKHAPNTPGCGEAIEVLFRDAGFPSGVLRNLRLSNEQAARLIGDDRLRGVTLTGSSRAGHEVAGTAGSRLKTMVLELGGSDPFIVLDDAPLERAIETAVKARIQNSGQSCIASKRFLIHETVAERFLEGFVQRMRHLKVGNPLDSDNDIGPLAREDLRENLHRQVRQTASAGARILCGGEVPSGRGFFYPPTVLTDIPEGSAADGEELFGPAASIWTFDSDESALSLANRTSYGLGASLWTSSLRRAEALIPEIEAGCVAVNGLVRSDPRVPFGGVKDSGFGRELGREGARSFVNLQTVIFD